MIYNIIYNMQMVTEHDHENQWKSNINLPPPANL